MGWNCAGHFFATLIAKLLQRSLDWTVYFEKA